MWCDWEASWRIAVAKNRMLALALGISTRVANLYGFPLSKASALANSSRFLSLIESIWVLTEWILIGNYVL